jgi:hypothetical protein
MKNNEIKKQDEKLEQLSHGIAGLKHMAIAISNEVDDHEVLISNTSDEIDFTTGRINASTNKMKRLSNESGNKACCLILILIIIIFLLIIVYFI